MRFGTFVGVVAGGLLAMGCLPGGSTLKGGAFVHPRFPYAVTYEDEDKKSLLGDDWLLENYRVKQQTSDGKVELERKDGYETTYELDFDDDNKTDAKQDLPLPDLVLTHRKTDARLEVSTILLDKTLADKELRVLLNDIVESQSGTRALFAGFGHMAVGVSKHYATRLIDSQEATLGAEKGLVATIERADVDQLQLNKESRARRSRLFLMRAPFRFQYASKYGQNAGSVAPGREYSVLLLVEYTNSPADFDAQYPDFVRLLGKVHVLTDEMLVEYLGAVVQPCAGKSTTGWLQISISADGSVAWRDSQGLDVMCVGHAIGGYFAAATGKARDIKASYDFSKPQKPSWLAQAMYQEQRAEPVPTKPDAPAPAAVDAVTSGGALPATPSATPPAAPNAAPPAAPNLAPPAAPNAAPAATAP